jgi:hypothetical protein
MMEVDFGPIEMVCTNARNLKRDRRKEERILVPIYTTEEEEHKASLDQVATLSELI